MTTHKSTVFLIDDDVAVQHGVTALLTAADHSVAVFNSAEDFLSKLTTLDTVNTAMLLDVCMPGIQGLELQEQLYNDGVEIPVIVMTGHGDVPMAVRAMQNGAVDFLEKPFTVEEVVTALDRAFGLSRPIVKLTRSASPELTENYESLSPRENEVLRGIVDGGTSKEIARTLDVSPRTIEVHRHNVMSKMNAKSIAELVRMAVALGVGD